MDSVINSTVWFDPGQDNNLDIFRISLRDFLVAFRHNSDLRHSGVSKFVYLELIMIELFGTQL